MVNRMITGPRGFRVGAVKAGIKASGKLDLGVIVAEDRCNGAAVFTTNKVVAPSVVISREKIRSGKAQAVFVNAGNANACTGRRGERDVHSICREMGRQLDVDPDDVLVCSTGIIGEFLPMDKVRAGIAEAAVVAKATSKAGRDFARAIMTTDLREKTAYREIKLGSKTLRIAGTAKGSGMIAPNMATMLAFITTDAAISSALLRRSLKAAVDVTFNKVSVDNHQSTSDTAIVLASGWAQNKRIAVVGRSYDKFAHALWEICDDLARQMAADGEGATCAVTVRITGAASGADAHAAVRAIVDSPLVRTAFNGADPNWGRIVSAVGYSGARFKVDKVKCAIAGVAVFRNGRPCKFNGGQLSKKMRAKQWDVEVDLGAGRFSDMCYTCDLSHGYVTINADYHT